MMACHKTIRDLNHVQVVLQGWRRKQLQAEQARYIGWIREKVISISLIKAKVFLWLPDTVKSHIKRQKHRGKR